MRIYILAFVIACTAIFLGEKYLIDLEVNRLLDKSQALHLLIYDGKQVL